MSRNLVELIRRHHGLQAPTALAVLKEAMDERGELTDDDRRRAAEVSGLPEAAVYGVSTFYDDLIAPRGARHVRVCTGTACFAATGGAHVAAAEEAFGLKLGERSEDGVGLARRDRLPRLLPLLAGAARRRDDGRGSRRGRAGRRPHGASPTPEPVWQSVLDEPVLIRPGDWSGLRRALTEWTPVELLAEVKAAEVRGRGGAGFPAGVKWEFTRAAPGDEKVIVANGDEGDPGSYIDKYLMEQNPALLLEGLALAGYAVGAAHGFVLYALGVPALEAGARRRDRARRTRTGCSATTSSARASRSTSRSSRAPARTSSARRRRCSPACRGCAARSRPARRSPPSAACSGCRRS